MSYINVIEIIIAIFGLTLTVLSLRLMDGDTVIVLIITSAIALLVSLTSFLLMMRRGSYRTREDEQLKEDAALLGPEDKVMKKTSDGYYLDVNSGDVYAAVESNAEYKNEDDEINNDETCVIFSNYELIGYGELVNTDKSTEKYEIKGLQNTIGRGENCRIKINSKLVSRKHAKVELKREAISVPPYLAIVDLESKNGTSVNGKMLSPYSFVRLHNNDLIKIGDKSFYYHQFELFEEVATKVLEQSI